MKRVDLQKALKLAVEELGSMSTEEIISSLDACSNAPISYALENAFSINGNSESFYIGQSFNNSNELFKFVRHHMALSEEITYQICDYVEKYVAEKESANDDLYMLAA